MENVKTVRIWQILTLLLVLCNLGILLTIWIKPDRPRFHDGPSGGHGGPRNFMFESLKPDENQTKAFDVLINEHHAKMEELKDQGHEIRQVYFMTLTLPNTTQHTKDSLAGAIALNQQQIESFTYEHFSKIRTLCTETQKATFDKILPQMLEMMRSPHGESPQHGRPHGEEPNRPEPPPPPEGMQDAHRNPPPPPLQ